MVRKQTFIIQKIMSNNKNQNGISMKIIPINSEFSNRFSYAALYQTCMHQNNHTSHLYDFSPLCFFMCLFKLHLSALLQSQSSHLKGFSPVCFHTFFNVTYLCITVITMFTCIWLFTSVCSYMYFNTTFQSTMKITMFTCVSLFASMSPCMCCHFRCAHWQPQTSHLQGLKPSFSICCVILRFNTVL